MPEYQQILKRAREQNINLIDKLILIPKAENRFYLNDSPVYGRLWEDTGYVAVLRDVEEPYSETGFIKEPFIYRVKDKYKTYLSGGSISYLVEFYVIE